jgi:hypothetical protein
MANDGEITLDEDGAVFINDDGIDVCEDCCGGCFPDCQKTPTSTPTSPGVLTGGCDVPSTFGTNKTYTDEGDYHSWTWDGVFFFTTWTLEVRCDKATSEVAAVCVSNATVPTVGGSDSTWTGFKVSTNVDCDGDNLTGSFVMSAVNDPGIGDGSCTGTVTITL